MTAKVTSGCSWHLGISRAQIYTICFLKCFKVVKCSQSYTAEITTQPLAWCHMKDHLSVGGTNMSLFIRVIISDFKIKHETTWLALPKTQQSGCIKLLHSHLEMQTKQCPMGCPVLDAKGKICSDPDNKAWELTKEVFFAWSPRSQ